MSEESRAKLSATRRGRQLSGMYVSGHRSWWKGKRLNAEHRARISAGLKGHIRSVEHLEHQREAQLRASTPEVRAKQAEAAARNHAAGIYFRGPTSLELALRGLLQTAGLEFEEQVRFGRYVVDAWVPSHGLVFEADGSFWYSHKDKEREARRDAYLMNRGAIAVIHLTEEDL